MLNLNLVIQSFRIYSTSIFLFALEKLG